MRVWMIWALALALQCWLLLLPAMAILDANETMAMKQLTMQLSIQSTAWQPLTDPCAFWRGVACTKDNRHIESLILPGLPRSSVKPPYLSNLTALMHLPFLVSLNASQLPISGSVPDWFGSLSTLETLDLSGCSLNGSIPSTFTNLSSLQYLSLANNQLGGSIQPIFGTFSNLTYLNLSGNNFVGSIPDLSAPQLTILDLSQNNMTGGIQLSVSSHQNLQILNLANNMLNSTLSPDLGSFASLNQLDLSSNFLQGSIPLELGRLWNLTQLKLSNNNLTGLIPAEVMTGCKALRVLNLDHNHLEGEIPTFVSSLQSLQVFHVSGNNLRSLFPSGLLALPDLQVIDISLNSFYGPLPQQVTNQQTIQILNMENNYFNGSLPMGIFSSSNTKKNCLAQVERQHTLRACKIFYARLGVDFSFNASSPSTYYGPPPVSATTPYGLPSTIQQDKNQKHLGPILAGVFGGIGLILFVGVMVFCLHPCQMLRNKEAMVSGRVSAVGGWGQTFTYSQLQSATNKFSVSNLITTGHTGDLYRGEISGGTSIVVKKIDLNKVKRDLYLSELEVFDKASHTKLVSLLGHCLDREEEKFLVYKFYPNSDLASSLHKKSSSGPCEDGLQSLDWITRLKIAIGTAEGLAYLHSECTPPIIHRDVKASSILLDDKYEVRIGSLSDARMQDGDQNSSIFSRMFGFSSSFYDQADPSHGVVSGAYDVYCFGKILLELVSGKLGISGSTDQQWLDWALPLINVNDKDALPRIVDPSLIIDEDLFEEVWAVAIIAKACLNSKPSKRPSMKHILKALENPHKVVREENFGEPFALRTSLHSSWNDALFGSWRHHTNAASGHYRSGDDSYPGMLPIARQAGSASSSGPNSSSREVYHLHHTRRGSSDIVPEPIEEVADESDDESRLQSQR